MISEGTFASRIASWMLSSDGRLYARTPAERSARRRRSQARRRADPRKNPDRLAHQARIPDEGAGHVERVVGRTEVRHDCLQPGRGQRVEVWQGDAGGLGLVAHNFADAAGDRRERNPRIPDDADTRDHLRRDDHVLDRAHADDAETAAHRVEDLVVTDQGAGVRLCRLGGCGAAADLQRDDRLAGVDSAARRGAEALGVANRFDKDRDGPGRRVVNQVVDHPAAVDVGLVAGGDEAAQADVLAMSELAGEVADRAALGHDGQVAAQHRHRWRDREGGARPA